ncbi:MAG: hypothetical protein ACI8P9_005558 [Parasphingorhabdus sp.]|jgi:hypothetical protein
MNRPQDKTGSCLCGAIQFKIMGTSSLVEYCHCDSCRKASGAPVMAWAGTAIDDYAITQGEPECYASSPDVERTFCKTCGTSLTQYSAEFPGEIYVSISILDDPTQLSPNMHIWRSNRLSWFETSDNFPRYSGFKSGGVLEDLKVKK